jgi:uncharacterized membrane protein
MRSQKFMHGVAISVVAALTAVSTGVAALRAAGDRSESLVYAVYNGQNTAADVFKTMRSAQGSTGERIEAYAVVSKDMKGKIQVRDQRKTDAGVGAVVGGVVGLLGGPVAAALAAGAGGVVGYLTGDAVGIPRDKVESMKQSLTPDSSAIVVVLNDRWVQNVEKDLQQAQARQVIANQIASK